MPTIQESQAKLSASMTKLSQRAKDAAEHTTTGAKMKDDLAPAWAGRREGVISDVRARGGS